MSKLREPDVIDGVIAALRGLIPDAEIRVDLESREAGMWYAHDFVASVQMDSLHLRILGEVYAADSSANLRDRVQRLSLMVDSMPDAVGLIAAPYLSRQRREMIREAGLAYADLSGNAYLRHRSLFIMVEGETNRFSRESGSRGAFSGKASLVPELLLEQSRAWGIRELAQEAGLDPGHVSRVAAQLAKGDYISRLDDGKIRVRSPEDLLRDWLEAYKPPKAKSLMRFVQVRGAAEILQRLVANVSASDGVYALAGPAGASMVAPYAAIDRVDVYVGDEHAQRWLEEGLSLRPVERGANCVLHVLDDSDDAVMRRRRVVDGLWVVSDLRLYLDLRKYPRRGLEQAEHLLDQVIRPRWESR